jgi:hypothetical protein
MQVPLSTISLQLKYMYEYKFFFSTEPLLWKISTILYIVLLHGTVDTGYFLQNFSNSFSVMNTLQKILQMNTVYPTERISHMH